MSPAQAVVRRYMERCNSADAAGIAECFTADAVIFDLNHAPVRGADEIGEFWVRVRERWQGARWSIVLLVGDGDHVAMEWEMTARRDDQPLLFRGADIVTVGEGGISEIHQYWSYQPDTGSSLVGFAS